MKKLFDRVRVILKAAPTYLVAAGTVVSIVSDEISKEVPDGWQDNVVAVSGPVIAVLATAVLIIRRVTPVLDRAARGLLPPGR